MPNTKSKLSAFAKQRIQEMLLKQGISKPDPISSNHKKTLPLKPAKVQIEHVNGKGTREKLTSNSGSNKLKIPKENTKNISISKKKIVKNESDSRVNVNPSKKHQTNNVKKAKVSKKLSNSKETVKKPHASRSNKINGKPKNIEPISKPQKRKLSIDLIGQPEISSKKAKLTKSSKKKFNNNFIVTDLSENDVSTTTSLLNDSDDSNADSYIDKFFDSDNSMSEPEENAKTNTKKNTELPSNSNEKAIQLERLKKLGVFKPLEEFAKGNDDNSAESDNSEDSDSTLEFVENENDVFVNQLDNSDMFESKENAEDSDTTFEFVKKDNSDIAAGHTVETSPKSSHLNAVQVYQDDDHDDESYEYEATDSSDGEYISFSDEYDDDTYDEDDEIDFDDSEDSMDTSDDYDNDKDEVYNKFLNGKWDEDSVDDHDYSCDDVYIPKSEVKYSKIPENETYQFDSDVSAQILDLDQPPISDFDSSDSSANSCPPLVSIAQTLNIEKELNTKMGQPITVEIQPGPNGWQPCPFQDDTPDDKINDDVDCFENDILQINASGKMNIFSESQHESDDFITANQEEEETPIDNDDKEQLDTQSEKYYEENEIQEWMMKSDSTSKSKLKSKFFNSTNSQNVLLLLKDLIYFHGILKVKLIAGSAEIFGYPLELNCVHTANSPRGHSYVYIKSTASITTLQTTYDSKLFEEQLRNEFKSTYLQSDLNEICDNFDANTDAILLLERSATNHSVNMIKKYMKQGVFPIEKTFNRRRNFYATEAIIDCQIFQNTVTGLEISKQWTTANMEINGNSRCLVAGGKGVGKSTLIRYLINTNVQKYRKMLLIDLDIGQPELFVPQTISATVVDGPILGVGYLQNSMPIKSYLFGEINVLISPIQYYACVCKLLQFCNANEQCRDMPWIVNTMGYNRGFGSELIAAIICKLCPSIVVQIDGRRANDNFDWKLNPQNVNDFKFNIFNNNDKEQIEAKRINEYMYYNWKAVSKHEKTKEWNILPKDLRLAMILSRLGDILRWADSDVQSLWDVQPICSSIHDLEVIVPIEDNVNPKLKLKLLNGNLVYLCHRPSDSCNDDDKIVECLGIGIVRNVDYNTEKIYLLPAIPTKELVNVNKLAVCSIPLPGEIILNPSRLIQQHIPYVYNTNDAIASKKVIQQTFRPDRFTQGKHVQLIG